MNNLLTALLVSVIFVPLGYTQKLNKPNGTPIFTKLNTNNISTYFYNDGNSEVHPLGNSGTQYPAGTGLTTVLQSGLLWGAKITGDPQVRVGGSAYRQGLQAGKIISPGIAEDPDLPKNRIYRVRSDVYPGGPAVDLTFEAFDEGTSVNEVRLQYEKDWNEWPWFDGAPFTDVNSNGTYQPLIDIPGVKGAKQTIWYVANDLDSNKTIFMYGAKPLGIEMQATFWNYGITGFHDNTIFKRYLLINKSLLTFNDMYISQWSDPDIGDATDDFAGCDTMRNFGFAYNAYYKDGIYGKVPPSAGYDLLQGPLTSGIAGQDRNRNGIDDAQDFGYRNGRRIGPGFINLPMTAYYYFTRGDQSVTDPTQGSPSGSTQFYNFFQGKVGLTGQFFVNPINGKQTKFALSGDPIIQYGWVDGIYLPAGDRRMGLSSGPFNMAPQDSQEIFIAEIISKAKDRLNSVRTFRFYDHFAQRLYDSSFQAPVVLANPPAIFNESAYSTAGIHLNWNQNSGAIENYSNQNYTFQGYNIYQLNGKTGNSLDAIKMATFDKVDDVTAIWGEIMNPSHGLPVSGIIQNGTNSGIEREFLSTHDYFSGGNLVKGKPYYYAVSYYTHNPGGEPKALEIFSNAIEIIYQDSLPGISYNDTLRIHHISGNAKGGISAVVDDPAELTGHDYEINFEMSIDWLMCSLKDITLGTIVLDSMIIGDEISVDGIRLTVLPSYEGMIGWEILNGALKWTDENADGFGLEGFEHAMGNAYQNWFSYSTVGLNDLVNVLIKFADADTGGNVLNFSDPDVSFAYRYLRGATLPPAKPEFVPFIINPTAGYAYQDYNKQLPFAVYTETNPPRRLSIGFLENNVVGGRVNGRYNPPSHLDEIDNVAVGGPREWFFIFDVDYSETPAPELQTDILNNTVAMMWMGTPNRMGPLMFQTEDEFLIIAGKPYTENDIYTFNSLITPVQDKKEEFSYQLYQNYPNPFNPVTTIKFSIPERSNVRLEVFNILGQKVTTLVNGEMDKGIYSQQFNASRFASGVYIYRLQAGAYSYSRKLLLLK